MKNYKQAEAKFWQGRTSEDRLYLHELIQLKDLTQIEKAQNASVALLGYACDEGVSRNLGRPGAIEGPNAIRKTLSSLSNHWHETPLNLCDFGDLICTDQNLESHQNDTAQAASELLKNGHFPIIMGGGHDLAYAHFKGIRKAFPKKKIGIVNLDAHFDLREGSTQATSGTPFWQIAQEEKENFTYYCFGIQKESNNRQLFQTASDYGVRYLMNSAFNLQNWYHIQKELDQFIEEVELIYLSIDLDGFSSAYAPGVSAPSPLGFAPDVALKTIKYLVQSQKLVSVDVVELNPEYDLDNATARLASRLIYALIDAHAEVNSVKLV